MILYGLAVFILTGFVSRNLKTIALIGALALVGQIVAHFASV